MAGIVGLKQYPCFRWDKAQVRPLLELLRHGNYYVRPTNSETNGYVRDSFPVSGSDRPELCSYFQSQISVSYHIMWKVLILQFQPLEQG